MLRKVFRGKFGDALKQAFQNGQLNFQGDLKLLAKPKIFAAWVATALPTELGGVLETPLRRPPLLAALSRPLYPSRGHLQPSPGVLRLPLLVHASRLLALPIQH